MSPWQSWGVMLLLVILVALIVYILDLLRRPRTPMKMHIFYVDPERVETSYAAHITTYRGEVYSVQVNDVVFKPKDGSYPDPTFRVEYVGPHRIGVRNMDTQAYYEFTPEGFIETFEVTPLDPHTPRHASR